MSDLTRRRFLATGACAVVAAAVPFIGFGATRAPKRKLSVSDLRAIREHFHQTALPVGGDHYVLVTSDRAREALLSGRMGTYEGFMFYGESA